MTKVQSMTGFGKGEVTKTDYVVSVEIKSVNHRFKDIRFKMSSIFSSIEIELKKILSDKFKRGSFDIFINFKRGEDNNKFDDIDENKVKSFLTKMKQVSEDTGIPMEMRAVDFLKSDFYRDQDEDQYEALKEYVKQAFTAAVNDLEKSRQAEGAKLVDVLKEHRATYNEHYSKIESLTDLYQKGVEDKLRKRFEEFGGEFNLDEPRFMQEVIFYLEKLDVHEEINRISVHLQKLSKILDGGGEIGRQIDFLVQELNRETNTIGSKSGVEDISNAVVQMKVQLEKIREQALNIE